MSVGVRGVVLVVVGLLVGSAPVRQLGRAAAGRSATHGSHESAMAWRSHGKDNDSLISSLKAHGIVRSSGVERAMRAVDRSTFLERGADAYADSPQPIGYGQTISAPHMHAHMLEKLEPFLKPGARVLDVGSGSGYLTAVIASAIFGREDSDGTGVAAGIDVYSELVRKSRAAVQKVSSEHKKWLDEGKLVLEASDGWNGRPEGAPYDAIHVGAAAEQVPDALAEQLKPGGRLVVPVGKQGLGQELLVMDKQSDGSMVTGDRISVMFVPLQRTHGKTL